MEEKSRGIAIYSRKSRFTGKGDSVANQVEMCRVCVRNLFGEEAAEHAEVFEDEGFSGGNLNRPAFQKMMEGIRQGTFRALVVYRLDRISRNINDFAGLMEELNRYGVAFVSIREQFDTSTPMGRAMMFIISVFSQLERETIAERIRDNMHQLARTGRWLGGNPPIGYRSTGETKVSLDGRTRKSCHLVMIPEEAEIPGLIFDLYSRMDSLTGVEAELLRQRIQTRQGKDFSRFAIKGILQNPVYMVADGDAYDYFSRKEAEICGTRQDFDGSGGIMAYNRTDQQKGRTAVLQPVHCWIIAPGKHPGLIPSRQWIRVQESLERNKSAAYRKPRRNEALLTGLLFCDCGERMYPKLLSRTDERGALTHHYVCKMKERSKGIRCCGSNLKGKQLDVAVMERLAALPENMEIFRNLLKKGKGRFEGEGMKQINKLRGALTENERKINTLIDSLGEMPESDAVLRILKRIEELEQKQRELRCRLEELKTEVPGMLEPEQIETLARKWSALSVCLEEMSLEEKRAAIRMLVQRIWWDGNQVLVTLKGEELSGKFGE